jgi:hypothetical protein
VLANILNLLVAWVYRFRDLIAVSDYNFVNNPNQKDCFGIRKKFLIATDFLEIYHNSILNIIFVMAGNAISYWFIMWLVFINLVLFRPIRYLSAALYVNLYKILILIGFIIAFTLPVTYTIWREYKTELRIGDGSFESCTTFLSCWNIVVNYGVRAYGGISDYLAVQPYKADSLDYIKRQYLDMLNFFGFKAILMGFLFALLVDGLSRVRRRKLDLRKVF